jgi:hypothetical protein
MASIWSLTIDRHAELLAVRQLFASVIGLEISARLTRPNYSN